MERVRGRAVPATRAHQLGGRVVLPRRQSLPMERLRRRADHFGGRGVLRRRRPLPMERTRTMAAPAPRAWQLGGTGSPAQAVVATS